MSTSSYIHETAVIDEGVTISDGCKIWHFCHLMIGAVLGDGCILGQNVFVGRDVILGKGVKVQNNVSLYSGVRCEDEVFVGPSVVFTNVINPRSGIERKDEFKDTLVKKGASIGANATIICGNTIGRYAMVGAGSVVTKNVKDYELVVGNPAKHHGWISRAGHKLEFKGDTASCPQTGEQYALVDGIVSTSNHD